MTASMTASRVLGPDEPTRDGDQTTVTLTLQGDYWRGANDAWAVAATSLTVRKLRQDPATVVTRPMAPERKWQVGDVVLVGVRRSTYIRHKSYFYGPSGVLTDAEVTELFEHSRGRLIVRDGIAFATPMDRDNQHLLDGAG